MDEVIEIKEIEEGIVQIKMQDKSAKNTFSQALMQGLVAAFQEVSNNLKYKVVILTGYDNYFCCGGTKEELLSIHNKELKFSDLKFFTLPLHCKIPVIAAMQGHAIGGGFVFGLYADFAFFSKEYIYTANFMRYGFTPGMGGTLLVPLKIGEPLGSEMLYTAENYSGGQLKELGTKVPVYPQKEVLSKAMELAKKISQKPRKSLVTLKHHLTRELREKLPALIEQELKMHEITFHQKEVAEQIDRLFQ